MKSEVFGSGNPQVWSHSHSYSPRPARKQIPQRDSVACRHHQSCSDHLPEFQALVSGEPSTSGRNAANIPSLLDNYIHGLPACSKRRRLLLAGSSLGGFVAKWRLDLREQQGLVSANSPTWKAVTASVLPAGGWSDLSHNYIFQAGFWGWFIAQSLKIFTKRYKQGVWDIRAVIESGGMPSSHSSLTAAVTTAVALEFGLGSSLFAVALCFTVITMYDAAGVRRHAGKQAEILNILLEDVLQGHPVSDRRLKEVLGHTPVQVLSGAILGVVVACFVPSPTQLPIV